MAPGHSAVPSQYARLDHGRPRGVEGASPRLCGLESPTSYADRHLFRSPRSRDRVHGSSLTPHRKASMPRTCESVRRARATSQVGKKTGPESGPGSATISDLPPLHRPPNLPPGHRPFMNDIAYRGITSRTASLSCTFLTKNQRGSSPSPNPARAGQPFHPPCPVRIGLQSSNAPQAGPAQRPIVDVHGVSR